MSPLLVPEVAEVFSAVGENMVYVFYSFFFFLSGRPLLDRNM